MFGGSKLQASGFQKGPFATAKQHLIACRNRAQTYPQKLPNAPSELLEKISPFWSPAAVVWWLQAASIRLPLPNVASECLEKNLFFCLLQLLFGGSKLQASGFQKGPFATAKQHLIACRNRAQTYPQKLPNVPSECLEKISLLLSPAALVWFPSECLEKISFLVSCSSCLVAPSCKHQASRRDPSPQQNST